MLGAALFLGVLGVLGQSADADAATYSNGVATFGYTGTQESFTVPEGVESVGVVAVGAAGGDGGPYFDGQGGPGGAGARIKAILEVDPYDVLFVTAGGAGQDGQPGGPGAAGFNGGASGGDGAVGGGGRGAAGGGGGASDIRICGAAQTPCPGGFGSSLSSRVLIAAGGGGGGGATSGGSGVNGGAGGAAGGGDGGGGSQGANGTFSGLGGAGGTSSAGGEGGEARNVPPPVDSPPQAGSDGTLAIGGIGGQSGNPGGGGGGGGGLYGGGGGGSGFAGGGGGAGSSLLPPGATGSTGTPGNGSVTIFFAPPVVTLDPAAAVSQSGATLIGTVNPQAQETIYGFEYGLTDSYGQSAPAIPASAGDGVTAQDVQQAITGLEPDTTYHYRLTATNAVGTTVSVDRTFTTEAEPPTPPDPPSAALGLEMRADPFRPKAKAKFTYLIAASNDGPDAAEDVQITGRLPRGQKALGASRACTIAGRDLSCTFALVAAGAERDLTLHAKAQKRGKRRMQLQATSATANPDPAGASASTSVKVKRK